MTFTCCGDCGSPMEMLDYRRINEYYAIKKTGWRCRQCGKVVEKVKEREGVEYK